MKRKISISIDEKTIEKLENMLENYYFRNKSHIIEIALNKFMGSKNDKKESL